MPPRERASCSLGELPTTATPLIHVHRVVYTWSREAEGLFGRTAADVLGRPARAFLDRAAATVPWEDPWRATSGTRREGASLARRGDRVLAPGTRATLTAFCDGGRRWQLAAFDGLVMRSPQGIAVLDPELRSVWLTQEPGAMVAVTGAERAGRRMCDTLPQFATRPVERQSLPATESGLPALDVEYEEGLRLLRPMSHASPQVGGPQTVGVRGRPSVHPAASTMATDRTGGSAVLRCCADPVEQPWFTEGTDRRDSVPRRHTHSLIAVPVAACGVVLGLALFLRLGDSDPLEDGELTLAVDLAFRAAVSIDNAPRHIRGRMAAPTAQRSHLPGALPPHQALDVAHRYLPRASGEYEGDWFDVIPLSGVRVALVLGAVTGHGTDAAAAMGRLRTAVATLSAQDLAPAELLARLNDMVLRLADQDAQGGGPPPRDSALVGTTCLYVVYDPVSSRCAMANAGHESPEIVMPDGTIRQLELPAGPSLGVGAPPFTSTEFELPEGATLALFNDGLLDALSHDNDRARALLRTALGAGADSSAAVCDHVMARALGESRRRDLALLVARTRALRADQIAELSLLVNLEEVSTARSFVGETLTAWGLDHLSFTTRLVVSELVTNAIRYGSGPITVRLVRHEVLLCEVADGSGASPRMGHARADDEGGRGLCLIAQMTRRWGIRHTHGGKVIWTEQQLSPEGL